jgi:4-amino-4-deoxy-L-arabinose transferase-like glycosyltransferase
LLLKRVDTAPLVFVAVLALALRLWGINFGLPYLYHPDEPAHVLQALAVIRGLPNGLTFANPPLYKYLLAAVYGVTFGAGRLSGTYASGEQFIAQFRADPGLVYLEARVVSAVLGTSTVLATYWVGRSLRCRSAAVVAAALAAVTYLTVRESHFGVNDALAALCVTIGLGFCVRIAHGGNRLDYAAAGVAVGLAFAAKYQGGVLLVPLVLAHFLSPRPRQQLYLALAVLACVVATAATFPSLVLEPARVVQDVFVHLYVPARTGYDGLDPAGGYAYYAKALTLGLGLPLLLAACAGIVLAVARRDRGLLVVASLPLTLIVILGASQMYFARFVLPAAPALVVLGAFALVELHNRWGKFGVATTLIVAAATLVDSVQFDVLLMQPDTRTEARDWIQTNLEPASTLAVDSGPLGPPLEGLAEDVLVVNDSALIDHSLQEYRDEGIQYLVVSSYTVDMPLIDPAREARRQAFSGSLEGGATLLAQFRPFRGIDPGFVYDQIYGPFDSLLAFDRPGPTVTVYRLVAGADKSP